MADFRLLQRLQLDAAGSWQQDDDEESQLYSSDALSHSSSSRERSELYSSACTISSISGNSYGTTAMGPSPPSVINVQHHVDHAIHLHSRPPAIFRNLISTTPADIQYAGLLYAGFEP